MDYSLLIFKVNLALYCSDMGITIEHFFSNDIDIKSTFIYECSVE